MRMKARDESGFTMIMTVIGVTLVALFAAVAVVAANGDSQAASNSANRQQAYEAALAGIHEYAFHLHVDQEYWAKCTRGSTEEKAGGTPIALNEIGSTANRRPVPGAGGSSYALELIPAEGHTKCDPTSRETAAATMLETRGTARGTFRVRSTGYFGDTEVKVMATFKPKSFLEYVYFTQLETSDPVTYGNAELVAAANRQCSKTIYEGRYSTQLKNAAGASLNSEGKTTAKSSEYVYCNAISFVGGDNVKGPMHTNDAFVICEKPTLGRSSSDPIEVSYPTSPGWFSTKSIRTSGSSCIGYSTNFKGTLEVNSAPLVPPATNQKLESAASSAFHYTGEVEDLPRRLDDESRAGQDVQRLPLRRPTAAQRGHLRLQRRRLHRRILADQRRLHRHRQPLRQPQPRRQLRQTADDRRGQ